MCGSAVTPKVIFTSASVFSSGTSRSSTGPSKRWMKAAVMRCGPAAVRDRWRHDIESVLGIGLAHPDVEIEQCGTLAVHRHLDLLLHVHRRHRRAAVDAAERLVVERDFHDVVAVGGKHVDDGEAAACADGCAVDVTHLRAGAADLVGDRCRGGAAVADGQPADLARRAEIAFHQRRRERLDVGYVVEALADRVRRQVRHHVHVDAEQIVDGAGVLGAIQPLKRPPAGIGIERRCRVHPGFERVDER